MSYLCPKILDKLKYIGHFENLMALKAFRDGAPGEIRTPDPLVRSQVLYPAELRAHRYLKLYIFTSIQKIALRAIGTLENVFPTLSTSYVL